MRFVLRATTLATFVAAFLMACGGGGGGSSPPQPANTIPPTAAITSVTPAQRVMQQPVSFVASGTTPTSGTLTYSWSFGDGGAASGAAVSHSYATHGDFTVQLTVTDAGGLSTSATQSITVLAPPTVAAPSVDDSTVTPNVTVTFTASGSDPQGSALDYTWTFGDGATATGTTVTHAFSGEGVFQVRVTARNAHGLTTTSTAAVVTVAWPPLVPPSVILWNGAHHLGQTLFVSAAFLEPNGLAYSAVWDFGDSGTLTTTDVLQRVWHTYAQTGTYTVRLTVTNAAGRSVGAQRTVNVQPTAAPAAAVDNVFQPYCSGSFCSATNALTYSGTGVGVWRYHNSTGAAATINFAIDGVRAQQAATLVFSNGRTTAAALPSAGTPITIAPPPSLSRIEAAPDEHEQILAENQRIAASVPRLAQPGPAAQAQRKTSFAMTPAVGATRTWRETGTPYELTAAATCEFSTGRGAVIWIDAGQVQRGELDPTRVQRLTETLCGPNGACELLVAQVGDVWGTGAAATPNYVQDSPALQDLHIAIPGVPQSTGWGGYFAAYNLLNTTADPTSNAAVAVVLNGWVFANYEADASTTRGTLIHELKHLINFYQRSVVRNAYHSSWLEETSAMLAEDLISPRTAPWYRTEARVGGYAFSGAGNGYIDWTHPAGQSYNQGGSFGAFLHRRYGASLDRELMTMCSDNSTPESSYDCVDQYITRHGGLGFEDEFARMGASTLGFMMGSALPLGFGYPGMIVEGSPLAPIGNFALEGPHNDPPLDLGPNFGRTTHTFLRDYIDTGQTTFRRDNVVVPAGTTLMVVVSDSTN